MEVMMLMWRHYKEYFACTLCRLFVELGGDFAVFLLINFCMQIYSCVQNIHTVLYTLIIEPNHTLSNVFLSRNANLIPPSTISRCILIYTEQSVVDVWFHALNFMSLVTSSAQLNSMLFTVYQFRRHRWFHGIPWNSMGLLHFKFRWHKQFHCISWTSLTTRYLLLDLWAEHYIQNVLWLTVLCSVNNQYHLFGGFSYHLTLNIKINILLVHSIYYIHTTHYSRIFND